MGMRVRFALFVVFLVALMVGGWRLFFNEHRPSGNPMATAEQQGALAWLKASDEKFQRTFVMLDNRKLTPAEIAMLNEEIAEGERHRKRIQHCDDQALIDAFDQYLTTMQRMVEGSSSN